MAYLLKQSSTARPLLFLMVDSTDHVTPKTGLTPTVTISKNGGSFASPSGSVSEIANGWYQVAGNATDTATLGPLVLHATGTAADPTDAVFEVVAFDPSSATNLGLSYMTGDAYARLGAPVGASISADIAAINGDLVDSGTLSAATFFSATLASSASTTAGLYVGHIIYITGGTGAGQARTIITHATSRIIGVDRSWITTPDNTSTYKIFAADNPALNASLQVAPSSNRVTILSGTAQTGSTSTTIKLSSTASATDNIYVGNLVALTGGTGVGQTRTILSYVGSTKVATVDRAWVTTPDNTTTFDVQASTTSSQFSDQGIAQAGGSTTITLASTASTVNSVYVGSIVTILSGTGTGQSREITGYVGSTRVATVATWGTNPDGTSVYAVIPSYASVTTSGGGDSTGVTTLLSRLTSTRGGYLDRLALITSTTSIQTNGLVSTGTVLTIFQGETINATSGNLITMLVDHTALDLTGFTPKFGITKVTSNSGTSTLSVTGTVNNAGASGQSITFALSSAQTAALALSTGGVLAGGMYANPALIYAYRWEMSATDGSSNCPTLGTGYVDVKARGTSC